VYRKWLLFLHKEEVLAVLE